MSRFHTRFTSTCAKRVLAGAVTRAASRSRGSRGFSIRASSAGSSATPVTAANGHAGAIGSRGLSVTLISDSRALFSKKASGTVLDFGTVTALRSKNAAKEKRSRCLVL